MSVDILFAISAIPGLQLELGIVSAFSKLKAMKDIFFGSLHIHTG